MGGILLGIVESGTEQAHGLGLVLVLAALILTFHHHTGGQVGNTHRRVGGVHVLTASTGGPVGVDAQVFVADLDISQVLGFGHDGHRAGRGVDTPLGFRGWHPLHPVGAGFKLEAGIDPIADDPGNHLLVAAVLPFTGTDQLHFPAILLRIFAVHAEQVTGKNGGLVTAGAGAHLKKHIGTVAGILGQHQLLQLTGKGIHRCRRVTGFFLSHFTHVRIAVILHGPGRFQIGSGLQIIPITHHHRVNFRILPGKVTKFLLVANNLRVRQQTGQFLKTVSQLFQLALQRRFHRTLKGIYFGSDGLSGSSRSSSRANSNDSARPSAANLRRVTLGVCSHLLTREC